MPDLTPDPAAPSRDRSALVLCGGGSHGALEVGFARAIYEAGHRPDMILGTSIGALNGAFLAAGAEFAALERLWRGFRLRKAVRPNWRWLLHPRARPGFLDLSPMRAILRRELPVTRFEDLTVPLTVVTTDLTSGKACYWQGNGDMIEPIIASMSLPGVFPPVALGASRHIDGGIADNAPLGRARKLGASRAFMIECTCAIPCAKPPSGWFGVVGRAFEIALERKHKLELERHGARMQIFRVEPQLDIAPGLLSFAAVETLISAGYEQTRAALAGWPPPGQSTRGQSRRTAPPRRTRKVPV
jgi:NTE family protein